MSFGSDGDDYGDDDFEDYGDDDCEEDEPTPVKPPSKPAASKPAPKREEKKQEEPVKKGSFAQRRGSKYGVASANGMGGGSSKATPAIASFNPNAKRVAAIKAAQPLTAASFSLYSQPQTTKYQSYVSKLRAQEPNVVESVSQFNDGNRHADVQTEDITSSDKSCFARNGEDDTVWCDVLEACASKDSLAIQRALRSDRNNNSNNGSNSNNIGGGLDEFLERASRVCESLLEENLARTAASRKTKVVKPDGIFEGDAKWIEFGDVPILEKWPATQILTSAAKGTTIYTVHPAQDSQPPGLPAEFAAKSLIFMWETYDLTKPTNALYCDGAITSASLGDVGHIVVAGLEDGAVAIWDLRESKHAHVNSLSASTIGSNGEFALGRSNVPVRAPSVATNFQGRGVRAHASKIVGVRVREGGCESLDDRGQLTSWFLQEKQQLGDEADDTTTASNNEGDELGRSPNSSLGLGVNRSAWLTADGIVDCDVDLVDRNVDRMEQIGPRYLALWELYKGEHVSGGVLVAKRGGGLFEVDMFSGSCVAFEVSAASDVVDVSMNLYLPGLFLVSRADGRVDLYKSGNSGVMMSWGAECWSEGLGSSEQAKAMWSAHRPGLFYVGVGNKMFVVDLMVNDSGPVEDAGLGFEWDGDVFSTTKGMRSVGKVLMVVGGGRSGLKARYLCDEYVTERKTLSEENEREWMVRWIGQVVF
jgi:hypothetical protein